ncbi:ribonuclease [Clostridium felsineum]|uniref:Ribonuclease n=1 Tax=Clostridium felsineum TaxID=36839 RepID=A0A1S8MFP9_9CLOT|nr:ribonuclease [Clostridium felsineum]MCR3761291.1 ribonuclease [Clostridium felsineum]URZ01518.1 Ribonuclease [Clostridium felsineum]URZ05635.1 Ribonuclease [Clostridium felsineum]URZ10674.1 Ribonuclease [Clostridium felsineum]URZ17411.1 Ribonuclease [Clostridium felsineum DSM 794]
MKKKNLAAICLTLVFMVFGAFFNNVANVSAKTVNSVRQATYQKTQYNYDEDVINDFQGVADYIHENGTLPDNYITKEEASDLGWRPGEDLWDYAPGKSIGGDIFTNSERVLPYKRGRVWHECDINYNGGHRGADRLLYSNDGLIYGTSDHYETFTRYY